MKLRSIRELLWRRLGVIVAIAVLGAFTIVTAQDEVSLPQNVTIAGSIQSVLGCASDWMPECDTTSLVYDAEDDVWQGSFDLPAGEYEYKAALNGSWDENYGAGATLGGDNIPLIIESARTVQFFYDHKTHWVTDDVNSVILVAVGDFQSSVGCAMDFDPTCLRTWMQDEDANGIYSFVSESIPVGDYNVRVALNQSDDVVYGAGGVLDGEALGFSVPTVGFRTTIGFSPSRNLLNVRVIDPSEASVPVILPTAVPDTTPVEGLVVTVPGSYNAEVGCSTGLGVEGDWAPDCEVTLMSDPDGDGVYTYVATSIPEGNYEAKVAINKSWSENYGADGARDGQNIRFEVPVDYAQVTFSWDSGTKILMIEIDESVIGTAAEIAPSTAAPDLSTQQAHWVTRDTIAWNIGEVVEGTTFKLFYAPEAGMIGSSSGFTGGSSIDLTYDPAGLSEAIEARFPHLRGYSALKVQEADWGLVPGILRMQAGIAALDADGKAINGTGLQIPGVLDDIYHYDGPLGISFNIDVPVLRVWAPTAQRVRLRLFDDAEDETRGETINMEFDRETGVWSVVGQPRWLNKYYLYEVKVYAPTTQEIETNLVTDPYSISLSMNSTRSHLINLNSPGFMPRGWHDLVKPELAAPEDIVIYELHVRDFSIYDATVPEVERGTFKAFTRTESAGMQHLLALAEAGLTHVHILPAFDIATINEDPSARVESDVKALASFPPDSEEQQALIEPLRDADGFNWGYDPYHYTVPEGSYSTDADGPARVLEFREMVYALNQNGLRVVMDVVYNHTNSSGQNDKSVLDQIVPGYYHRLNNRGGVETSTCCQNTATEYWMMEKLMIDSLITWATVYKVDGFRFDLMGHHMRENMVHVREALDALTIENSGVDGKSIYIYGEGWNFGEVQDNARGVNATQLNMGGLGIGTFNDRLRDAVRGGSPFGDRTFQGFISGLGVYSNGLTGGTESEQLTRSLLFGDQIRIGLAGNLRDYTFVGADGSVVSGADISYNGQPAGYTLDPQEQIVYVSKHDNETLWDILLYKQLPDVTVSDLVRMQNLGNSIVLLSQGVPFFQAGDDMLRSKSLDRNSYNSGDWFNRLDFTYQTNNFAVGLPPRGDNGDRWAEMQPILANTDLRVSEADILAGVMHFREMLAIRKSSPLFRLQTAEEVQARLSFQNVGAEQIPGVIVMTLADDGDLDDLDPNYETIVVVFNARPETLSYVYEGAEGQAYELHPILVNSGDAVVQEAAFDAESGTFSVPGRTTAVFVLKGA